MAFTFHPWEQHHITEETVRLVIKDFDANAFYKLEVMHQSEGPLTLEDELMANNKWRFKYKFQVKGERWTDVTPYMELLTQEEKMEFERVILDQAPVEDIDLPGWFTRWSSQSAACHKVMGQAAYRWMRKLWTDPEVTFRNVPFIIDIWRKKGDFVQESGPAFLDNLLFYFSVMLDLDRMLKSEGLHTYSYPQLRRALSTDHDHALTDVRDLSFDQKEISKQLRQLVEHCEKYAETLQLAAVLRAKLESLIGDRALAAYWFQKAASFDIDYLKYLSFEQGVYSYIETDYPAQTDDQSRKASTLLDRLRKKTINILGAKHPKRAKEVTSALPNSDEEAGFSPIRVEETELSLIGSEPAPGPDQYLILLSLDEHFLRSYGAQLMHYATIMPEQHFHLHLVGERDRLEKAVEETRTLYHQLRDYRGGSSVGNTPTFSVESIPAEVQDRKTYAACARFLRAKTLMERYETSLFIMDADLIFLSDPGSFFKWMQQYDLALPFPTGLVTLCPWRRVLAGNLYIKNNRLGHRFLTLVQHYISQELHQPQVWTLDQNALLYAFEQLQDEPELRLGDCYAVDKPMTQGSIHRLIERR